MKTKERNNTETLELKELCILVKNLIEEKCFNDCESIITDAMKKFPHSPIPHNLLGILLEKMGDHQMAMNHFRAAWSLDSTFLPARKNLTSFGTFVPFASNREVFYDENDCIEEKHGDYYVEYDKYGIGRVKRRA